MERLIKAMHINVESSRKNPNERHSTKFRNPDLLKHTEQLISTASSVLDSRSTAGGGSKTRLPQSSEKGQPLGSGQKAKTPTGTNGFNIEEVQSTDSDSDDDYDIAKKCFERAKKDFSLDQHAKALESFRAGLKRVERLGLKKKARLELRTIHLRIGLSLLSLGELGESEQRLLSLTRGQTKNDKGARLALHASSGLAQIYLCRRSFEKAEDWCNKSRIGWKRVAGKEHPAYITCLRLSAFSSELNGNHAEAAAFEEIANESRAAPVLVDTWSDSYESLGFTIEKSRTLVTEYHKKAPHTIRKEESTQSKRRSPAQQAGSDSINGLPAQTQAEVPVESKSRTTAVESLHDAAREGDTALLKRLLENGVDIEEVAGKYLERPIHVAAWKGHRYIVESLLNRGANIEAKNKDGCTALIAAARKGHRSTVECLLNRGVNIEAKDDNGHTALSAAAWYGHKSIVECLLNRGVNIEAKDDNGHTALSSAAWYGHKSIVECLLDRGADIEAKGGTGRTALISAAWSGHKSIIECVLDRGASIEAKDKDGDTALTTAAQKGHRSTVECLLDHGAKIEAEDKYNYTALMRAARNGRKCVVEYLLGCGADIEAKNYSGETPLLVACRCINEAKMKSEIVPTIELLSSKGADVLVKDGKGNSPLKRAREVKNSDVREELVRVLKRYGAKE